MARRRYQNGSVRRRGDTWEGRFRDYGVDPPIHRSVVLGSIKDLPTKRLAKHELLKHTGIVNEESRLPEFGKTFQELAERWEDIVLDSPNSKFKPSTKPTVRGHLKNYLVPHFGKMRVSFITNEKLQEFVSRQTKSAQTIRSFITTMRMVWRKAKAWGYATHNPFDGLDLPELGLVKPRAVLSFEDGLRLVEAATTEPLKTFLWISLETGLRAGELCGLCVEDLDLEDSRTLRVQRSAWGGELQTVKSRAGVRLVALSPELASHLRRFVAMKEKQSNNPAGLLFVSRRGTPLSYHNFLRRQIKPLLRSLGLPTYNVGTHALRHSSATEMNRQNVPVKVAQVRLGHSDVRTTLETYTHAVTQDEREFVARIGHTIAARAQSSGDLFPSGQPQGKFEVLIQ